MLSPGDAAIRIVFASLLGALIGLERDMHGRSAGLRTHILVAMGAAVFTIISVNIACSAGTSVSDPARIAAQIVTGIGFLGAGVILKDGANIRGLTTAACLWIAAAVGMTAGSGYYLIAGTVALLALFGLVALKYFEKLYRSDSHRVLSITSSLKIEHDAIIDIIKQKHIAVLNTDIERDYLSDTTTVKATLRIKHKLTDRAAKEIIALLESSEIPLKRVEWSEKG
ncbi:MAG: MgtC/SapB family protein [Chitinivibrionales bacterium]|nr:MgtC/SapB family protein [Chitinivibrionales bacterium]